jgi:hypothetical protein
MRWKRNPTGKDLYRRRRKRFLWLPRRFADESRWLESATIEEEKSFGPHENLKRVCDGRAVCRYCENFQNGNCSLGLENKDEACPKFQLDPMWLRYIRRAPWEPVRFVDAITSSELEEDPELFELIHHYREEKRRTEEMYLKAAEEARREQPPEATAPP